MKIIVINLKRQSERKQNMMSQFERLGITNYEFFDAIDASTIENVSEVYDEEKANRIYRKMGINEIACTMSHKEIYKKIMDSDEQYIIMEDDVTITDEFVKFLDAEIESQYDFVFFGYFTDKHSLGNEKKFHSEIFNPRGFISRCYFNKDYMHLKGTNFYSINSDSFTNDMVLGGHAYYVSKNIAKLMYDLNTPIFCGNDVIPNYMQTKHSIRMFAPLKEFVYQNGIADSSIEKDRLKHE